MVIFICVIVPVCLLLVLARRGRTGHRSLAGLGNWSYAHRGLHGGGVPENSMAAFRKALDAGYGIELDLHLMKDGNLAVIHDASLKRTAGVDVKIEDLTAEDLENYRLEGTEERIPLFSQVQELFESKAPMIIELKAEGGNHAALTKAACRAMEGYSGLWCMESFDPRCLWWLKQNRPDVVRGQLAENFVRNGASPLPWYLKWILSCLLQNFLTQPDFVAYKFSDRKNLSVAICRRIWGIQGVSWTLKTQEEYDAALKEGYIPIFEDFCPPLK